VNRWLAAPVQVHNCNGVPAAVRSRVFLRTLSDCFGRLHARPATEAERRRIDELAVALVEHRVELMPRVAETLYQLGLRHHLVLLTKGEHAEQQAKLDASGLARYFRSIHIVAEKNVEKYRGLIGQLSLGVGSTWMIGNSPKSDIIPAWQAGWNAVFIPNQHTWALEHAELDTAATGEILEL
jgi:putative hydrolase of the HAD superfamily